MLLNAIGSIGDASSFGMRALRDSIRPPFEVGQVVRHMYEFGSRSLPLIGAAGFAVGAVMSMHTRASLERFGAEAMIPAGLGAALIKETGPLVTALLFSGRVGAGIGAELGAMRVSEQIDALETLAIDSFKYLVVTRVLACIAVMPLLVTVANFAGIVGGYTAETVISGMSFRLYWERAFSLIGFSDYIPATMKTTVFGFIIGTTSAYLGYNTAGGAAGVGQAATRSVVISSILVILSNVILVKAVFMVFPPGF